MTWKPIEAAKKDRPILALMGGRYWSVAHWEDDESARKAPRPYWRSERGYLFGVTWDRANQPTKWLPLPAPPVEPEDGR
jgi:hypothetical protein